MTRMSLQIVLDEPRGVFHCGADISGTVNVVVREACKREVLIIALGCKGSGNASRQAIAFMTDTERKTLFTGEWRPGTYSYPFILSAPDGNTYNGNIMTVNWYLRAGVGGQGKTLWNAAGNVTTSSGFEIEDEKGLDLVSPEVAPADRYRQKAAQVVCKESAGSMNRCILPSVLLFIGGLFAAWMGLERDLHIPGLVVAAIGLGVLGFAIRQALIDSKIAMIELRIGSVLVWPGERVPCSITLQAKTPIEIERATITLEGWEHVKQFTGMHRSTGPVNRHVAHADERVLELPAKKLPAGVPVHVQGEFEVPASAPCTMDFDNEVKFLWHVVFRIKIPGSPDWFDVQPITVLPRKPV